ncbi:hypothetical protein HUN08_01335 [Gordonia sp. X0973]|uniref:hypothetical protein n=1 Tax=Gordonia sp. X0973 TaxID=2742602 RepID=UPI000F534C95|nr:hypothetical protein [Gordonia sp. X0973]QKT05983.1 hypothetical protein HUN08_01335 [Gordonia sp. X0973]
MLRKAISAGVAAAAAATGIALATAPATADTPPPPTVTFSVSGYRIVGSATYLPEGRKSCDFERSAPDPGPIIGSFGNDMVPVGSRLTSKDHVTFKTRPVPRGRYLLRLSCFIKNRKSGMYTIVATNEQWISVTGRSH